MRKLLLIFITALLVISVAHAQGEQEPFSEIQGVTSADWSLDGAWLAVGNASGVWLYDTSDFNLPPQQLVNDSTGQYHVSLLAFYPSVTEHLLAIGGAGGAVQIWDIDSRQMLAQVVNAGGIADAVFSPDGTLLAVADLSGFVHLWNWRQMIEVATLSVLTDFDNVVAGVAFNADGTLIAAANRDGLWLWSLPMVLQAGQGNAENALLRGGYGGSDADVNFAPDGRLLVGAGDVYPQTMSSLHVWEIVPDGTFELLPAYPQEASVTAAAITPDGVLLATANANGLLQLWFIEPRGILEEPLAVLNNNATALDLSFSPDGIFLASLAEDDVLRVWLMSLA